jgi:formyltetrahydrofolate deformylase
MTAARTATLLISCPDQPGLVAAVSDFVFRRGGNIVHADQHTDPEEGVFLQRVEWLPADPATSQEAIEADFAPIAARFGMEWAVHLEGGRPRVALLVSRLGHCMYDLLARWRMGELPADIPLVVSNHEELRADAERFGVAFHHLPVTPDTKAEQEARMVELLADHEVDIIVLARYMQILTPAFVDRYPHRIINIHHSFLPAFVGARPYHRAHERGVKVIGATAHFVTSDLDEGPIIEQDVVRVSHRDSVGDLVRKGRDLEMVVLARAVRLHLEHRVLVYGNKTVVFD